MEERLYELEDKVQDLELEIFELKKQVHELESHPNESRGLLGGQVWVLIPIIAIIGGVLITILD
ncbi:MULTISPECIES: bZIP transcription factor [Listeria]|uniref:bZIP transcription factor n=1 Tax=Listeria TaxID=1637 RepID=UPI000B58C346|nr:MULTISPECIES: bZIP transcription factor [Listeria]